MSVLHGVIDELYNVYENISMKTKLIEAVKNVVIKITGIEDVRVEYDPVSRKATVTAPLKDENLENKLFEAFMFLTGGKYYPYEADIIATTEKIIGPHYAYPEELKHVVKEWITHKNIRCDTYYDYLLIREEKDKETGKTIYVYIRIKSEAK